MQRLCFAIASPQIRSMRISISSSQYRLLKGTLTLIEMTPSLLQEIESVISDPLRPVANWAKMLLDGDLSTQQVELRNDVADGLQISRTGKFLLLLSELNLTNSGQKINLCS